MRSWRNWPRPAHNWQQRAKRLCFCVFSPPLTQRNIPQKMVPTYTTKADLPELISANLIIPHMRALRLVFGWLEFQVGWQLTLTPIWLWSSLPFDSLASHNGYPQVDFLRGVPARGDYDEWNRATEAMELEIKGKYNIMLRKPIFPQIAMS